MNGSMMSYVLIGVLSVCCAVGAIQTPVAVPAGKPVKTEKKLPAITAKQWECRVVGPFGIRPIPWQPGMQIITNNIFKIVNNSASRIHAVNTNAVLSGDFTVKVQFKRGSFIGLVKADCSKGLLGLQVMGGSPHTLVINRTGSEVTMLLDGQRISCRNYDVKKTDTFLFGMILNKKKTGELYGFECKTAKQPATKVQAAGIKK